MEKPWEQKLKEQQEKDEKARQDKEMEELNNKRAPHLTNLNEDVQLSGKLFYSLKDCFEKPLLIGRHDGNPTPQIVLRGVGIQTNHAKIELTENGMFKISVAGKEAWEQTMVNGMRLEEEIGNKVSNNNDSFSSSDEQVYSTKLHHLDRIFVGINTIFLFKYPLMRKIQDEIRQSLELEVDSDSQIRQQIEKEGLLS